MMRVEVPKFKRCCLCIPLRRGILSWAYISLAYQILIFFVFAHILYEVIVKDSERPGMKYAIISIVCVLCLILILAVHNGLIIVASHKKSIKLLKVSYIYGMVLCALWCVYIVYAVYSDINYIRILNSKDTPKTSDVILDTAISQAAVFLELVLQGYLILLLRSEMLKLQKQRLEIEFVNNSVESEARVVSA